MDKIIQIDALRIERNKPRKCVCENPVFTLDTTNREVTCECGVTHDPFDALYHIAEEYERINEQHRLLHQQAQEWIKTKPYSVLFKKLEQHYRRGTMLPHCPKCDSLFDFQEITSWGNAEFYRRMMAKERKEHEHQNQTP